MRDEDGNEDEGVTPLANGQALADRAKSLHQVM